jgi:large subunit ribosomal protein L5e
MPFVKIIKNKAYFKRFQVKYRRRREGKTDYQARRRLVLQDRTKYNTPKYRLVARITNKDVVAQVVQPTLTGDRVVMAAYSHELPAFGVKVGLTNYSACYCTGLLLARRVLAKLGLDKKYAGTKTVNGEYYSPENEKNAEERRPFKAILDAGLCRTTTGARVFGVLKGAVDGGVNVPHSEKRFPGFNKETEKLDAAVHRNRIFGQHVSGYMKSLQGEDPEEYSRHFSRFIKEGITADKVEAMYKAAHAAIRADPTKKIKKDKKPLPKDYRPKSYNQRPRSLKERKNIVRQKIQNLKKKLAASE